MRGNREAKKQAPEAATQAAISELAAQAEKTQEAEIKYNIYKALELAAQMEAENITVERQGGRVTLRGTAKTWAEREAMERAAWVADGVFEVINEIKLAA